MKMRLVTRTAFKFAVRVFACERTVGSHGRSPSLQQAKIQGASMLQQDQGGLMLQHLDSRYDDYGKHADRARQRALECDDPMQRAEFLKMAERWLEKARRYEDTKRSGNDLPDYRCTLRRHEIATVYLAVLNSTEAKSS
jgi:hypothetical protein